MVRSSARCSGSGRQRPASSPAASGTAVRHGLARVLSKLGLCSRGEAVRWIRQGRVKVGGRVIDDPEFPIVRGDEARIRIDDQPPRAERRRYLMLNKPRGLVTTAHDEHGRATVYRVFDGAGLPWLAPVGRLDKASEGLLLFSNDPEWAARITDPGHGLLKTYHVQVATRLQEALPAALEQGVEDAGEWLAAHSARWLRQGERNAWLEIVLAEGRNRQIRRLLAAQGIEVLRLVRVAIGELVLGELANGAWRELTASEVLALATPSA